MRNIRKLLHKKHEGSMVDFLSVCIGIVAMTYVMTAFFSCNGALQQKILVGQVTRDYLLKMETTGYLSGTDQNALINELKGLGLRDISLAGSTTAPVAYGERIVLAVSGTLTVNLSVERSGVFEGGLGRKDIRISQKLTSTAKQ